MERNKLFHNTLQQNYTMSSSPAERQKVLNVDGKDRELTPCGSRLLSYLVTMAWVR